MPRPTPEPWLRNQPSSLPVFLQPIANSLQQSFEDIEHFAEGLTNIQLWTSNGAAPAGFHLKHMAGSIDRLTTYLLERELSQAQLLRLVTENQPGGEFREMIADFRDARVRLESYLATLSFEELTGIRYVGRKRIPVTVIALAFHIAEHTQRHVGQFITATQVARAV